MDATPLSNGSFRIVLTKSEAEAFTSAAQKLMLEGRLTPTNPDLPALLRELDLRRDRLPATNRPRRYGTGPRAQAYDSAFEYGFRGWVRSNPYNRPDCKRAWFDGYAAGEAAFRARLATDRRPVAYVNGFTSGWEALPEVSPYCEGSDAPFDGQLDADRDWHLGYSAGKLAATMSTLQEAAA